MNRITIELCTEDRARLDRVIELLGGLAKPQQAEPDELTAKLQAIVDQSKNTAEEAEISAPPVTPNAEEIPVQEEEAPPVKEETTLPSVTLAQIQQKVVQLAAGFDGTKKAKVREIINAYAKKVSDLPEDKWGEVWSKLTALESEG